MGDGPDRVVLIGLRRAGKSAVGAALAQALGTSFHDTDEIVRERTGRSSAEWISIEGVPAFREQERKAIQSLASPGKGVIATGGGAPLDPRNRAVLRDRSTILYLRCDPYVLASRGGPDPARPTLAGRSAWEENFLLYAERDPIYRDFCDRIVDASGTRDQVLAACLRSLAS